MELNNELSYGLNAESFRAINDRDRAFKAYKRDKSEQNLSSFMDLRNKTQTIIYNATKNFFQSKLDTDNENLKSPRRSFNDLGMPSKKGNLKSSSICIRINIGGEVCFEKRCTC